MKPAFIADSAALQALAKAISEANARVYKDGTERKGLSAAHKSLIEVASHAD